MPTTPLVHVPVTPAPPTSPAPAIKTAYASAYVQIENFIFNPALVTGFLHRPAANAESVGVTELLYGPHHVIIEDNEQRLFNHLCNRTKPEKPTTSL